MERVQSSSIGPHRGPRRLHKLLNWRSALIYTHRWLGIAGTLVFVIWFVSGVVFMYVGMPTLPAEERLLRMDPLDVSTLAVI